MIIVKHFLFYGSLLVFPFLYFLYHLWKRGKSRILILLLGGLSVIFIDARFIEPYTIIHNEHVFEFNKNGTTTIRAVVYADPHIGIFRSKRQLVRDVKKINSLYPDIILMPGDFIDELPAEKLTDTFEVFNRFIAPAYAVAGNHDSEKPGNIASELIREAVNKESVQFIDNQQISLVINNKSLNLYGLSDIWEGQTDFSILNNINETDNTIVLVHNPDAVFLFPNQKADLVVSGHTHGGQVRIPWLYKKAIPTEYYFDRWWYTFGNMKLFITTGTGMVGLPLRFLNPAQVDVIDMRL